MHIYSKHISEYHKKKFVLQVKFSPQQLAELQKMPDARKDYQSLPTSDKKDSQMLNYHNLFLLEDSISWL
jgi:hypothetical protein